LVSEQKAESAIAKSSSSARALARRRLPVALVAVIALIAPASALAPAAVAQPESSAVAALAQLPIKGRAPKTGYTRAAFGPAWSDVDRNGCDTRNDILNRDLSDKQWRAGTHECVVIAGTLNNPYTGTTMAFVKANASAVQIDHVVALSNAWQTGAFAWSATRRTLFANDSLELLAVDGPNNERKGDGDAATWLPPSRGYRCAYVARQVAIKAKWGLWVTSAERDAIARVLAACSDQGLPDTTSNVQPPPIDTPNTTRGTGVVYYPNCTAARAAGAAPLHAGDPGYRAALDRDHDGIACE
jgi:hypothetical protein